MDNQELEKRLNELEQMYLDAEKSITKIINSSDTFTPSEKASILAKIKSQLSDLSGQVRKEAGSDIRSTYKGGKHDAVELLKDAGENINYSFNKTDFEAIRAIQDETFAMMGDAISGVNRSVNKILADATAQRVKAKFIEGRLSGGTLKQISDSVAGAIKDGFVSLVDKGGKTWELGNYSKMLVRTKMIESANTGMMNQLSAYGFDIVQCSQHNGACQLCTPWEGKLLSISGRSVGKVKGVDNSVDDAKAGGLFHPNCRHRLVPYHPRFSELSDQWAAEKYKLPAGETA